MMEFTEFLVGTSDAHANGIAVIQTKHADKSFSIDLLLIVTYQHIKRLHHSQRYELLHLAEGANVNVKVMHPFLLTLYKIDIVRYNDRTHYSR